MAFASASVMVVNLPAYDLNQSHPLVIALVRSASYFRYTGQNISLS
jgi:hypothetical protein